MPKRLATAAGSLFSRVTGGGLTNKSPRTMSGPVDMIAWPEATMERLFHVKRQEKAIISGVLSLAAILLHTGCASVNTVEYAKGHNYKKDDREVVWDREPKPGYYALLPLAIP